MLTRNPVEPAGALRQGGATLPKQFRNRRQVVGQPRALLHGGASEREFFLLAWLHVQRVQFGHGMLQPLAITLVSSQFRARASRRRPRRPRRLPTVTSRQQMVTKTRKLIQQRPMPLRAQQPAFVMLAVDFHQCRAQFAQQRRRNRLIVHERPAAAIGLQLAAQDDGAIGLQLVFGQQRASRMTCAHIKFCHHPRRIAASPHQPRIGTAAQHEPQRIKQDGFARPCLARKHNKARRELDGQRLDQHDILDGKRGQHGAVLAHPTTRAREAFSQARNIPSCHSCLHFRQNRI